MLKEGLPNLDRCAIFRVLRQARSPHDLLGELLVKEGLITRETLGSVLHRQATGAFHQLLELREGLDHFEAGHLPEELDDLTERVPLIQLLLEGLRVLDEKRLANQELPDDGLIMMRLVTNDEALVGFEFNEQELRVMSMIDGQRSLNDLAKDSELTSLHTKQICHRLQRIGLIQRRAAAA